MLVNHDDRIIVLLNPRTGTTTLRSLFPEFLEGYVHARYKDIEHMKDYSKLCFWRDPAHRFISTYSYMLETYKGFSKDRLEVVLDTFGRKRVDDITIRDVLYAKEEGLKAPVLDLFDHQLNWFGPEVWPLDFYRFRQECDLISLLFQKNFQEIKKTNDVSHVKVSLTDMHWIDEYCLPDYQYAKDNFPWLL